MYRSTIIQHHPGIHFATARFRPIVSLRTTVKEYVDFVWPSVAPEVPNLLNMFQNPKLNQLKDKDLKCNVTESARAYSYHSAVNCDP